MRILLLSAVLLAAGCGGADQYVYEPVAANSAAAGLPAVSYPIPPAQPKGNVRLLSFGIAAMQQPAGAPSASLLEVRLIVGNTADETPWQIDTRQILAVLPGEGTSRPALANTDAGTPPIVTIARGETRTVDLYYPLPSAATAAGEVPEFRLIWQVTTGAGVVVQNTAFRREVLAANQASAYAPYAYPPYAYPYWDDYPWDYWGYGLAIGVGPVWWYDPLYPSYGFPHRPPFVWGPHHGGRPHVWVRGDRSEPGRWQARPGLPAPGVRGGPGPAYGMRPMFRARPLRVAPMPFRAAPSPHGAFRHR